MLPRRGALHWSDAYSVMPGKNGCIMATPAPNFDNQLMWWIEEDVHEDLIDPKYMEPENLRLRTQRAMDIMSRWVATKDVEALFHEPSLDTRPTAGFCPSKSRGKSPTSGAGLVCPVSDRRGEVTSPGTPYHFSKTPWQSAIPSRALPVGAVADQMTWQPRTHQPTPHPAATAGRDQGAGFHHVLAGPLLRAAGRHGC